jgi:hypothetical protein
VIPVWNTLVYNLGLDPEKRQSGDNLYGVEPISYYIKNLLLTTGLALPLVSLSLILEIIQIIGWKLQIFTFDKKIHQFLDSHLLTMYIVLILWLGLLCTRPHKEERFLYPIYPLMAILAARSLSCGLAIINSVFLSISKMVEMIGMHTLVKRCDRMIRLLIIRLLFFTMVLFFIGRISGNYRNYHGYIATWTDVYQILKTVHLPSKKLRICTGIEWHLFPSHFFLPANASLHYIEDDFHGILPQPYQSINGTSILPPLPNNDENQEEVSRYTFLDECHYLISSHELSRYDPLILPSNLLQREIKLEYYDTKFIAKTLQTNMTTGNHLVLDRTAAATAASSTVTAIGSFTLQLLRGFHLPFFKSSSMIQFKSYRLIKVVNGGKKRTKREDVKSTIPGLFDPNKSYKVKLNPGGFNPNKDEKEQQSQPRSKIESSSSKDSKKSTKSKLGSHQQTKQDQEMKQSQEQVKQESKQPPKQEMKQQAKQPPKQPPKQQFKRRAEGNSAYTKKGNLSNRDAPRATMNEGTAKKNKQPVYAAI